MNLILKRVNENIDVSDIKLFLQPALKGGVFKKTGKIDSIKIQMLQEIGSEKTEYHSLVVVYPDEVALRVIKILNRKPCNGKPINISEYVIRQAINDRRQDQGQIALNRRKADRRRNNVQIHDVTEMSERYKVKLQAEPIPTKEIDWY